MDKWLIIAFIVGLLVALSIRTKTLDEPHTLAYDSEGMMKFAKEIVEEGGIAENDPLRYAGYFEEGWDNGEVFPTTPFAIAFLSLG